MTSVRAYREAAAALLVLPLALAAACNSIPTPATEIASTASVVSSVPDPVPEENADSWWTGPSPCPAGAFLVGDAGDDVTCHLPDGRRHGSSTTWENGSRLADGGYRNDKQHGVWTWYHAGGGVASQGRWVHGLKDGLWRGWNAEGDLVGHYEMRLGTGTVVLWGPDGTPHLRGRTVDGQKHGRWEQLAADSSVVGAYTMDHGTGVDVVWWAPGQVAFQGVWDRGVCRTMTYWDQQGLLASELIFAPDGSAVDLRKVYRDGELVETIDVGAQRAERLREARP